ncbi:MAG TPA: TIGR00730 family Rossman fold protein [Acidimicrobiales bacterium]|nr:TIGR00730 family Rossman fold protein [Acidimicrobiales bacterium]
MTARRVCVFCGSSFGNNPRHREVAAAVATGIAGRGLEVVYGGGRVGLMGVVADAALAAGGTVLGVIPKGLFRLEVAHTGLTELYEVGSMHERKTLMYDLADAFVALPGGFGTLEELAEVTTWAQLGLHRKPVSLFDVDGFWDGLVHQLDRMVAEGLLRPENRLLVQRHDDVDALLGSVEAFYESGSAGPAGWLAPDER